jgi:diacylglycerol kinase family enzyme
VTRRVLVIANPVAGGGRSRQLAPALAAALQARGCAAEVVLTRGAGDAAACARRAAGEPWDALVAVGGDGTVNEVVNGMPDPSRPLGVLPLGTANVLACEFGLPSQLAAAAAVIAAGRTRRHALGVADGRRFLLFCGIGVDGAVARCMRDSPSTLLGKRKWLRPVLQVVRRWPRFLLRATLADGEVIDGLSSVLVTRVRNYGGVLRLPRHIDAGRELLFVLAFRHRSRLAWLGQSALALLRCMHGSRRLLLRETESVRIDGAAPWQLDGDFGGDSPVAIGLAGAAANVLVP